MWPPCDVTRLNSTATRSCSTSWAGSRKRRRSRSSSGRAPRGRARVTAAEHEEFGALVRSYARAAAAWGRQSRRADFLDRLYPTAAIASESMVDLEHQLVRFVN